MHRPFDILSAVKRNPLFFHSISCKNNGFLFTTPNIFYISFFIEEYKFLVNCINLNDCKLINLNETLREHT